MLAFAFVPLALVPIAERFGRRPIFLVSSVIYALLHIPAALTRNYTAWAVTRALLGASGSCANMMVAGSISDMWAASDRGLAMNAFVLSIFAGQVSQVEQKGTETGGLTQDPMFVVGRPGNSGLGDQIYSVRLVLGSE